MNEKEETFIWYDEIGSLESADTILSIIQTQFKNDDIYDKCFLWIIDSVAVDFDFLKELQSL